VGEQLGVVGARGEVDELGDLVVGDGGEQRVDGDARVAVKVGGAGGELAAAVGALPVGEHHAGAGDHRLRAAGARELPG